jgi:hypothetical protein
VNWEVERDSRIYCCVILGSVSGVADGSVLVGYDAVPEDRRVVLTPSSGLGSPVELY